MKEFKKVLTDKETFLKDINLILKCCNRVLSYTSHGYDFVIYENNSNSFIICSFDGSFCYYINLNNNEKVIIDE